MGKVGNFFGDLKILLSAARLKSPPDESLDCMAKLVEVQARVRPESPALLCEGEQVSWKELNDRANVIANDLVSRGITQGECVSLFMQNRIAFAEVNPPNRYDRCSKLYRLTPGHFGVKVRPVDVRHLFC